MGFSYSPGMLPWKPMTSFAELTTARTPSLQETPEKSFGNYLFGSANPSLHLVLCDIHSFCKDLPASSLA